MVIRVVVIGAGAAGLAALRRLSAKPNVFEVVAMEKESSVGGTWVYTEEVGSDKEGLPIDSSMYANLKTNLPKQVMAYPGFPYKEYLPSFLTHKQVLDYTNDFTDHFGLRKHIKFNTIVENVRPVTSDTSVVWEVITRCRHQNQTTVEKFDAVFVCNGHNFAPNIPDIPGQDTFTGHIEHSHNYRHPEGYNGLQVVCLGAMSSGQDISLDISPYAKQVFICHKRDRFPATLPDNVTQKYGIKAIKGSTVVLEDGEELKDIDVILLCTGYKYSFPFLSSECNIGNDGDRVRSTYKHIIHTAWPSLAFIGLCNGICPCPHFDTQVRFAMAAIEGTMELPSREEMEGDVEKDYQWRRSQGMSHRQSHWLADLQWAYNDMLADMAGFEPLPQVMYLIYYRTRSLRDKALQQYKKLNFKETGPDTFDEEGYEDILEIS